MGIEFWMILSWRETKPSSLSMKIQRKWFLGLTVLPKMLVEEGSRKE
jgi:hypothetical protein